MELTLEFIKNELEGFYPDSRRITCQIIAEMYGMLKKAGWDEADFHGALMAYRNDPNRLETRTLHTPPDVRELLVLHNKNQKPPTVFVERKPAPAWLGEANYIRQKKGLMAATVFMVEECERNPNLHKAEWLQELERLGTREEPNIQGNLDFSGIIQDGNCQHENIAY